MHQGEMALSQSTHNEHSRTATLQEERPWTTSEAMGYLQISRSTLWRLIASGQLAGYKVGSSWRFYPRDVLACVSRESVPATREPEARRPREAAERN
jgi:excisionase family DNA binding protein